ncbi:hypothetical protein [Empedobacter falsenii]
MKYTHENLVKILNENFGTEFKTVDSPLTGEILNIDINDINHAVILFTNILNINSGSTGERDLYKLLQEYLTNSDKQKAINEIL